MEHDDIFRYVLVSGFVVVFPFGLYHRVKAAASRERLNRRAEGVFILATLRPIALVRMAAVLAYVIDPAWMRWSQVGLPFLIRWIGVGLGVSAAILLIVVFRTLGTNITDTVVTRKCHTLVTCGPYRWVRHPFYVAAALAMTADSLVTANWFLALSGVLTFGLMVIRTETEEQKLIERFGDDYRDYMARTGRFVPRMRSYHRAMKKYESPEAFFQDFQELIQRLADGGNLQAARELQEGFSCLNGLTDGWGLLMESIQKAISQYRRDLPAEDVEELKVMLKVVRKIVYRR